ncbi:MAG: hypothetical protein ACFB0C_13875 [Leptolyngbyaceae cyanobacterium]
MKYPVSELVPSPGSTISALAEAKFYLIKLATHDSQSLFGEIREGYFHLNSLGQIAADEWTRSTQANPSIDAEQPIIQPGALQGIVRMRIPQNGGDYVAATSGKPRLLSSFVAGYKAAVAKRINLLRNCPGQPVWQRSYYERLLTDEMSRQRTRQMLRQPAAS